MVLSKELIRQFLVGEIALEDPYYQQACDLDKSILEVFGDEYPQFMNIQNQELTERSQAYRKSYFENIGNPIKGFFSQIEAQIDKVFDSEDFTISFPNVKSDLSEKATAEYYFKRGYYNGESLVNNFRENVRSKLLLTPNTIMLVLPNESSESTYPRPYFVMIPAENILYYKANEILVALSETKSDVKLSDGRVSYGIGDIHYFFDKNTYAIVKHIEIDVAGNNVYDINYAEDNLRVHGHDFLPAKKVGRKIIKTTEDGHELRDSDMQGSIQFLKEAMMNSLNLAIEHNFHSGSQEYVVASIDCSECKGTGKVKGDGMPKQCPKCGGATKVPAFTGDGMNKMIIPAGGNYLGKDQQTQTVFGGYIERPETGVKTFRMGFETSMKLALQPFGLEHLLDVPYNQSGSSKNYDMQEGYAFIQAVSLHIKGLLSMLTEATVNMMYKRTPTQLYSQMPIVNTPKSFNLSSSETLRGKLRDSIQYSFPDDFSIKYSGQLLEKESGNNSEEVKRFRVKALIDPLPTANYNQKTISRSALSNEDWILTINIERIMTELIHEYDGFLGMGYTKQIELARAKANVLMQGVGANINLTTVIKPNANVVGENQTN